MQAAVSASSGGSKFLGDNGNVLPVYMALYPTKLGMFIVTALRALNLANIRLGALRFRFTYAVSKICRCHCSGFASYCFVECDDVWCCIWLNFFWEGLAASILMAYDGNSWFDRKLDNEAPLSTESYVSRKWTSLSENMFDVCVVF
jgi:hypothetical protein